MALEVVLVRKYIAARSAASFAHIWSKGSTTVTISIGNGIEIAMTKGSSVVRVLIEGNVMRNMIGPGAIVTAMTVAVMDTLIGVGSTIVAVSGIEIAISVGK